MDEAFQTTLFCLPVTALHTIQLKQDLLILAGQGSFLSVIDAATNTVLSRQRVFASSTVHGITGEALHKDDNEPSPVLIWGGSSICFASLRVSDLDLSTPNTKLVFRQVKIGRTIHAPDWILDASLNYGLPSSEVPACLITAHNELVLLRFGPSRLSLSFRSDVLRRCPDFDRISGGRNRLLYSARLCCDPLRDLFQITVGTTSGRVLRWSSESSPNAVQELANVRTGHKGAVFGVDQLGLLFSSCSDDREVRLGWLGKSTTALHVPKLLRQRPLDVNNNAAQQLDGESEKVIEVCKHVSRVWGVKFFCLETNKSIPMDLSLMPTDSFLKIDAILLKLSLGLVSTGEDGVCNIWQIGREGVIQLASDHYHVGKNIWSCADGQLGKYRHVITGGADGAIHSREIPERIPSCGAKTEGISRSFTNHQGSILDHFESDLTHIFAKLQIWPIAGSGSKAKPPSIMQYRFISNSCLLALTDSGYLLSCTRNESGDVNNMQADTMPTGSRWSFKRKFRTTFGEGPVMSDSKGHLVFLGNAEGDLFVCFPDSGEDEQQQVVVRLNMPISRLSIAGFETLSAMSRKYCIVAYSRHWKEAKVVFLLVAIDAGDVRLANSPNGLGRGTIERFRISDKESLETRVYKIDLLRNFEPTCAGVLHSTQALVLGSKRAGIAIYRPLGPMLPSTAIYTALGERLDDQGSHFYHPPFHIAQIHGGDEVTSISEVPAWDNNPDCKVECFLSTGRNGMYAVQSLSFLDVGINFEILDNSTTPLRSGIQGCVRHIDSGELILYGFDSKKFLAWNESQRSLVFSIDCENAHRPWAYNTYAPAMERSFLEFPNHAAFAWTQAKSVHIVSVGRPDHTIIQNGGHGREIKALSVSPLPYQDVRHGILNGRLVATGAEDTRIQFFAVENPTEARAQNKMVCIRTLKLHITGIQHLSFSSCGNFLFSSGGCEELYAWQIRYRVAGVHLGVKLICVFPKEADNSDLRITDFMVQDESQGIFRISAVYSNSMIKIFRYTVASSSCEMLRRFFYQDQCIVRTLTADPQGKCLTGINDCPVGLFAASTDGHVAFWFGGKLNSAKPLRHRVHQNSIKAMHIINIPSGTRHEQLVITGGDDGALGFTLMHTSSLSSTPRAVFQSLLIPQAHTAAITAICVLQPRSSDPLPHKEMSILLLSTGNDQHVKLWSVSVQFDMTEANRRVIDSPLMGRLEINLLDNQYTEVGDVGAMDVLAEGGDMVSVLVVGIGMEVLHFRRVFILEFPSIGSQRFSI